MNQLINHHDIDASSSNHILPFLSMEHIEVVGPAKRSVLCKVINWYGSQGCCCSVTQSCRILCDSKDCSMPGFPVLHHLPEFAQTLIHWVGDASQPSHPLLSPSPALSLPPSIRVFFSEFFQVASVLKIQHQGLRGLTHSGLFYLLFKMFDQIEQDNCVRHIHALLLCTVLCFDSGTTNPKGTHYWSEKCILH